MLIDYPFKESALQSGTDQNLPRLTPSNVDSLSCSRKFYTLHVLKQYPAREVQPSLRFGNAVHDVLKNVYDPKLTRNEPTERCDNNLEPTSDRPDITHLETFASISFRAYRMDAATRHDEMERAKTMVRNYVSNDDEDGVTTLGVEVSCAFPVYYKGKPIVMLTAKLDRVLLRASEPGTLFVRDYKTLVTPNSMPRVDMEKSMLNLWCAKLKFPGFDRYVLEYDFINDFGDLHREIVDGSEVKGVHALIMKKAARVLHSTNHQAEPYEGCQFCPLREKCPAIGAASPPEMTPSMASRARRN